MNSSSSTRKTGKRHAHLVLFFRIAWFTNLVPECITKAAIFWTAKLSSKVPLHICCSFRKLRQSFPQAAGGGRSYDLAWLRGNWPNIRLRDSG